MACPVNFEFLNYTIITSKCKGPQYPPSLCCGSFKEFACPYADVLNDLTNDCASTMFSYINLYGKYPPGLFASECREGKNGLECPASAPSSMSDTNGNPAAPDKSLLLSLIACFILRISSPDVFVYNSLMKGLTLSKFPYNSLLLYNELLLGGLMPDNYTYTFALKACSQLKALSEGKQVHCRIIKEGIAPDTYIHSSLIHMYANSSCVEDAERVLGEFLEENILAENSMISGYLREGLIDKARAMFENMAAKDVATWSAMITGYTKNGKHAEALALFRDMMISQTLPNESTLVSLLSACAELEALQQGRWIHAYIDKQGFKLSTTLSTALINMYAKCGSIECGYELFLNLTHRDIVTWGVIISGFAIYGQPRKCFELFDEMIAAGVRPNEVIFVAILTACAHAGCIKEGQRYFNQMVHDFGIRPSVEHYGCMVDLFGRAGLLEEAEELIISMPEQPNLVIWSALLSACRLHNDMKRGTWAFRHLIELQPTSGDQYKLAGLMLAGAGEKEEAMKIRKMINEREMHTVCGSSFIEIDGAVHEFIVGDTLHDEYGMIYETLEGINRLLKNSIYTDMDHLCW
ncbi:hypothetical protein Tsubulata_001967 [Turnera subulata]|uniref:GPI-anchored protein LLG1-like domain-containing protein n=1 Tax=Turnera subulata TaxID=218843 RepID=A0A9Q0F8C5_9ROSI|nr:hypothetical protein Tsubulata_001967 [Turnera subulata]